MVRTYSVASVAVLYTIRLASMDILVIHSYIISLCVCHYIYLYIY